MLTPVWHGMRRTGCFNSTHTFIYTHACISRSLYVYTRVHLYTSSHVQLHMLMSVYACIIFKMGTQHWCFYLTADIQKGMLARERNYVYAWWRIYAVVCAHEGVNMYTPTYKAKVHVYDTYVLVDLSGYFGARAHLNSNRKQFNKSADKHMNFIQTHQRSHM